MVEIDLDGHRKEIEAVLPHVAPYKDAFIHAVTTSNRYHLAKHVGQLTPDLIEDYENAVSRVGKEMDKLVALGHDCTTIVEASTYSVETGLAE